MVERLLMRGKFGPGPSYQWRKPEVSDLMEMLSGETMWLCREDDRVHDWAEGSPPHCWFMGEGKHNPECGPHLVVPLGEDA